MGPGVPLQDLLEGLHIRTCTCARVSQTRNFSKGAHDFRSLRLNP